MCWAQNARSANIGVIDGDRAVAKGGWGVGAICSSVVSLKRIASNIAVVFSPTVGGRMGRDEETAEVDVQMSGVIVLPVVFCVGMTCCSWRDIRCMMGITVGTT